MSLFLATVPAGTQLYHGTWKEEPIEGMEWLAFEVEHAMIFAQPMWRPPPPDEGDGDDDWEHINRKAGSQRPLRLQSSNQDAKYGYLHTYVPKNPLRLLYVDGQSGAKTSNGTLDTQDTLLLNMTDTGGPMGGEFERATGMCNLSSTEWNGKIDGILRMEGGFEIILCDFEKHLERTDVMAMTREGKHDPFGGWTYTKAVTSRYFGIGNERVTVDYEDFVSVFAYPNVKGLFDNDVQSDYPMPRLQNVQDSELVHIRSDVTDMILRKDWDKAKEVKNWQAVADEVVQRYSQTLQYLHTNQHFRKDKDALEVYLKTLLQPFIDGTGRNATLETRRCVAQTIPSLASSAQSATSLAYRTLYTITHHICDTLLTSLSIVSSPSPPSSFESVSAARSLELVDELVDYLNWTSWKECGTCKYEEVCFIPIWMGGTHEDHANPRCLNEESSRRKYGYWSHASW
ncbi:uncharacterized protein K460DRAFT_379025 [Cucurbitaria berberidis CBS 394.84]|uniref:Uncharacterized protein n=1 Tax=Cucurbitaria berberidis CBS 394.84 TaxID=1168544 RepID=A0A9P4L764_9PLEO|nr:uncharacterized protein K460DRAFT_379025 [Cucurbitaria berberidis CBS 394.84]KAF1843994.1 hypothetical protein K460DRAFT_379025 [Cucurbitaria berberidis CBS 394.84]